MDSQNQNPMQPVDIEMPDKKRVKVPIRKIRVGNFDLSVAKVQGKDYLVNPKKEKEETQTYALGQELTKECLDSLMVARILES